MRYEYLSAKETDSKTLSNLKINVQDQSDPDITVKCTFLYHSHAFLAQSMQLLHFFMFNNSLLWQATEDLVVSHFYFRHYFWSKYKEEKGRTITLELSCLYSHIWCKTKWKEQGHSRQFGLGCISTIYLKCFYVYFPPSTTVSNVISKPNKILPFKSLSFYNVSSITVCCHGVIANWHAKKGIYMSSSPLSSHWARWQPIY